MWRRRADKLESETAARRNWEDAAFRRDYLANRASALLGRKEEILEEHTRFFRQQDPHFIAFLRQERPSLFLRLTAEFEALLKAQQLEAAKPAKPTAPPPPAPRRKPTVEECRAERVERIKVKNEDNKAVLRTVLAGKAELVQEVEKFNLPDEEKTPFIEVIDAQVASELDQLVESKEGNYARGKILD